jgi:hypothetical protein
MLLQIAGWKETLNFYSFIVKSAQVPDIARPLPSEIVASDSKTVIEEEDKKVK